MIFGCCGLHPRSMPNFNCFTIYARVNGGLQSSFGVGTVYFVNYDIPLRVLYGFRGVIGRMKNNSQEIRS